MAVAAVRTRAGHRGRLPGTDERAVPFPALSPRRAPATPARQRAIAPPSFGLTKIGVMTDTAAEHDEKQRLKARELNELIRYTMWAVFTVTDRDFAREEAAAELTDVLDQANGKGIVTRGLYDLQGMRADADFMLWWVAPTSDELQEMYVNFRRTKLGYASEPVWSAMALHRPAEFNKGHIPAFLAEEEPRNYVCVYPFVRSYEWYLLEAAERRAMLAEHGKMAREYPDVRANTVSSFALNDYEWMLAFEADELHRIVDLMRHLREATARRHTRVEIPFYTGRRKPVTELVASLA
jgi:peroxiredoxin